MRSQAKQGVVRTDRGRKVAAKVRVVQRMTAATVKAAARVAVSPVVAVRRRVVQAAAVLTVTGQDDNEQALHGCLRKGRGVLRVHRPRLVLRPCLSS